MSDKSGNESSKVIYETPEVDPEASSRDEKIHVQTAPPYASKKIFPAPHNGNSDTSHGYFLEPTNLPRRIFPAPQNGEPKSLSSGHPDAGSGGPDEGGDKTGSHDE